MVIFHSYVKLPEGTEIQPDNNHQHSIELYIDMMKLFINMWDRGTLSSVKAMLWLIQLISD